MLKLWTFTLKCLSLDHDELAIFVRSQWQRDKSPNLFYLIYRWLMTCFFMIVWILSIVDEKHLDKPAIFRVKWLIYLTNWGFSICTLQSILGTTMCTATYISSKCGKHLVNEQLSLLKSLYKSYWISYSIALDMSIAITLLYWILIYDEGKMQLDALNVLVHGTNSAAMFVELCVIAAPTYLAHFIWTVLFGLTYVIFSVIYYAFDGTSREGAESIYSILNWHKPALTAAICIGVLIFMVIVHSCVYGACWLRIWLFQRFVQPFGTGGLAVAVDKPQPVVKDEAFKGYDNVAMANI